MNTNVFPAPYYVGPGLTKRELFAAMAMQKILSRPHSDESLYADIAHDAVAYADALLIALKQEKD